MKAKNAVDSLLQELTDAGLSEEEARHRVNWVKMDLLSFDSVRAACTDLRRKYEHLDTILVRGIHDKGDAHKTVTVAFRCDMSNFKSRYLEKFLTGSLVSSFHSSAYFNAVIDMTSNHECCQAKTND
jgi:hypothetical protein